MTLKNQRLRRFGRRSVGGSAGRVDRRSRSGQWFETHISRHERCLHVVARRAVEVRRTESSHATPRALPRAPARARAPCAQVARRPSVKSHDALSCEPTLETTTPVKHARSETARPIEIRVRFWPQGRNARDWSKFRSRKPEESLELATTFEGRWEKVLKHFPHMILHVYVYTYSRASEIPSKVLRTFVDV